jgi:hypothetical protein
MKQFLIIFFPIFVFTIISCDKDDISNKQAESFVKYYGGSLMDDGIRVLSLENGGYLLVGNIETADSGKQVCVIVTDEFGNSTGPAELLGFKYNDYASAVKKNNSGGFIIAGSTEESTKGGRRNVLLIQLKQDGSLDWMKSIEDIDPANNSNEIATDFLVDDDQSIVITGYWDNPTSQNKQMILLKTDQDGNLLDRIDKFKFENTVSMAIEKTYESGSYLIAGYKIVNETDLVRSQVFVTKWTQFGGYLNLINTSDPDNAEAINIIAAENKNYYVLCNVTSESTRQIKIKKVLIENNGIKQVWEKYYGESDQNIVSLGYLQNDKLFLVGTSGIATDATIDETYGSILLVEINNDGSSPIYYYIGDGTSFHGNGFDFTNDQGIILTGKNKINTNSMITLIKLNNSYAL